MRITPLDIYQHEFSRKKIGGLDDVEVNEFLKKVGREYEALYAENKVLKEQSERLSLQIKDYLELEKTLKQTLISAQKASGDLKNNAEREAELILREAEIQSERILDEARGEMENVTKEIRDLKRQKRMLKVELKTVLESYMAMISDDPISIIKPPTATPPQTATVIPQNVTSSQQPPVLAS
ncbi:MAG: DivIVA domain-containing protein [Candidatus Riflebacteria bacterium]|nr:DivIVA domain-containing protein [Candidatus Riflebacteria bacterium]